MANARTVDLKMNTAQHIRLRPGEEHISRLSDGRIRYSFCSQRGALFSCTADTKEAAWLRCEAWLFRQDQKTCY